MRDSESLAVEWRPIGEIRPYPGNPRVISGAAIEKVAASIKAYGWRQPIVVDGGGEIVVGHTRYLAAKKLKLKRVPVHIAAGLSAEEIRAYRLADNRTHEEAAWDRPALEIELKTLDVAGYDLPLTGFEPVELDGLFGRAAILEEMPKLPAGGKPPFEQMTFTLHETQAADVRAAMAAANAMGGYEGSPNENRNGNALARIAAEFLRVAGRG